MALHSTHTPYYWRLCCNQSDMHYVSHSLFSLSPVIYIYTCTFYDDHTTRSTHQPIKTNTIARPRRLLGRVPRAGAGLEFGHEPSVVSRTVTRGPVQQAHSSLPAISAGVGSFTIVRSRPPDVQLYVKQLEKSQSPVPHSAPRPGKARSDATWP